MNYKTTITGLISAGAAFVLFAQQAPYNMHFPNWVSALAVFCMVGGLAGFGISAKDRDVTGGTKGQPSTSKALHAANQAPSRENPPVEKP